MFLCFKIKSYGWRAACTAYCCIHFVNTEKDAGGGRRIFLLRWARLSSGSMACLRDTIAIRPFVFGQQRGSRACVLFLVCSGSSDFPVVCIGFWASWPRQVVCCRSSKKTCISYDVHTRARFCRGRWRKTAFGSYTDTRRGRQGSFKESSTVVRCGTRCGPSPPCVLYVGPWPTVLSQAVSCHPKRCRCLWPTLCLFLGGSLSENFC